MVVTEQAGQRAPVQGAVEQMFGIAREEVLEIRATRQPWLYPEAECDLMSLMRKERAAYLGGGLSAGRVKGGGRRSQKERAQRKQARRARKRNRR